MQHKLIKIVSFEQESCLNPITDVLDGHLNASSDRRDGQNDRPEGQDDRLDGQAPPTGGVLSRKRGLIMLSLLPLLAAWVIFYLFF